MKKSLLILSLILVMLVSACSFSKSPEIYPMEAPSPSKPDVGAPVEEYGRSSANQAPAPGKDASYAVATDRLVVRTAQMKVSVADPAQSMNEVASLANMAGGYVVYSNVWNTDSSTNVSYTNSSVTIRVPSEKLDEVMAKIRAMAVDAKTGVISESVSGQDVTSDFVDSNSQLENLQKAEKQLQDLLEKATTLEYTLEIFRELTSIRGQIEVLQGHIKYLKESADLSAITAEFIAEASVKPIEIAGWKPEGTARKALQALIDSAQGLADAMIWFGIYCLPFLIPLGVVLYFIFKGLKKRRALKKGHVPVVEVNADEISKQ